jgi:hypothetical protein
MMVASTRPDPKDCLGDTAPARHNGARRTNVSQTIEATYDGAVLRPDAALPLKPNTRVRVTVEEIPAAAPGPTSFLQTALALRLSGPPDWSANLDDYLYGHRD